MAPKIYLEGYLDIPEDRLEEVLNALDKHVYLTRKEQGCLSFNVWQSEDRSTRLNVAEIFIDRAVFEAHKERMLASDWYKIIADAERHYTLEELID